MKLSSSKRPTAIDLFSGAGGFSLGLEQAGFDVIAAIEKDPIHAAVHKYNFPKAHVIAGDISTVKGSALLTALAKRRGDIDLLIGGPPCQGFSMIGKRNTHDVRNYLVFEYLRLVNELKPKYFVIENVEGMAIGESGTFLYELQEQFKRIGYRLRIPVSILDAKDFGVPQSRRRVIILGAKTGLALPLYPKPQRDTVTVRQAIADLPALEGYHFLFTTDVLVPKYKAGSAYANNLRSQTGDPRNYGYLRIPPPEITGFKRAVHGKHIRQRFARTKCGGVDRISHYFRLDWNGVSHTLRAGSGREYGSYSAPRPIHPEKPRCISVREAARLQGFPDWFSFHSTIWHGFRQIGNSVAPPVARAIGREILKSLKLRPQRPTERVWLLNTALLSYNETEARSFFSALCPVDGKKIPAAPII